MSDGIVTKLTSVEAKYQARVHKEVLQASKQNLNVSVRYETNQDFFSGYEVFTMTDSELENYLTSGGQWTYISAKEFLNNSSSFSY